MCGRNRLKSATWVPDKLATRNCNQRRKKCNLTLGIRIVTTAHTRHLKEENKASEPDSPSARSSGATETQFRRHHDRRVHQLLVGDEPRENMRSEVHLQFHAPLPLCRPRKLWLTYPACSPGRSGRPEACPGQSHCHTHQTAASRSISPWWASGLLQLSSFFLKAWWVDHLAEEQQEAV